MSTLPGEDAWQDAGLDGPEPGAIVDLLRTSDTPEEEGEDYRPGVPRADVEGTASEADVADQAIVVDLGDGPLEGDDEDPDEVL
ncbi:hypothetical protein ATL41_0833 [Flavimobilis soli]|uniref:DUF5709 domain-containing protein n=1 Tax=Flavimobilis soli TaxID=442709 RepID=A0A2A9EB51_9MICO|nr:hypothetical protein [Flavimobilis soli]PFG36124.1 hypothetical protein ATL41_0833 [Flavimobilis soli]